MIKALAIKELRESAGLVAVAALGMAWAIGRCMGWNPLLAFINSYYNSHHLAFIGDDFYSMACLFIGGCAALLGLKQSAWEVHHNTLYFLFHRPMSRRAIIATKLIVGGLLTFGILAIAIVVYGSWAARPGHLAAPFVWSMTGESWWLAAQLPLVYLGGFLSGIRPGRWFGTRLLPLLAVLMFVVFVNLMTFWWLETALLAIGYVGWIAAIYYFSCTRDY